MIFKWSWVRCYIHKTKQLISNDVYVMSILYIHNWFLLTGWWFKDFLCIVILIVEEMIEFHCYFWDVLDA